MPSAHLHVHSPAPALEALSRIDPGAAPLHRWCPSRAPDEGGRCAGTVDRPCGQTEVRSMPPRRHITASPTGDGFAGTVTLAVSLADRVAAAQTDTNGIIARGQGACSSGTRTLKAPWPAGTFDRRRPELVAVWPTTEALRRCAPAAQAGSRSVRKSSSPTIHTAPPVVPPCARIQTDGRTRNVDRALTPATEFSAFGNGRRGRINVGCRGRSRHDLFGRPCPVSAPRSHAHAGLLHSHRD